MKPILSFTKGLLSATLLILSFLLANIVLIPLLCLCYLIPSTSLRLACKNKASALIAVFIWLTLQVIKVMCLGKHVTIASTPLKKNGRYIIIANHASWLDILIAFTYFNLKIPQLKFFLKKELLWQLPLGGLYCYLADYPFIERASKSKLAKNPKLVKKDINTTQAICQQLINTHSTLIIFPEGTRATPKKILAKKSPYQHLLKPKSAGVATIINEMHDHLDGIINLTLSYEPTNPPLWDFLCGKVSAFKLSYDVLPISPDWLGDYSTDRTYRVSIQKKLNTLWQQKDTIIKETHYD